MHPVHAAALPADAELTFVVGANRGSTLGNLVIENPSQFLGTVHLKGGGFIDLVGLGFGVLNSYSYSGNVLTLFNKSGVAVDKLHLIADTWFSVFAVFNPTGGVPIGLGGLPSGAQIISANAVGTSPT
jgi:hypothetical protein